MCHVTPEELSAILAALKERYTTRYLADSLKVSRPTIYNWARQQNFPYPGHLRKVLFLARRARVFPDAKRPPVYTSRALTFPVEKSDTPW